MAPESAHGLPERLARACTVARQALAEAKDDRITMTAQALAYSLFLAVPAALLVAVGVFSLVASPADVNGLVDRASGVIPPEAATLLRDSLRRSADSPGKGLVVTIAGLALAVWTTTSAATTLMQGITTAFDRDDGRGFVRKRLVALAIVACLILSAALVGCFLVLGPFIQRWIGDATGQPTVTAWVWWTAQWPVLVVALLAAFSVLLYLGPDAEQPSWRLITPGAVTALVIWLLASAGFSLYASRFGSYDKTWGSLSAVVVMLIWLWLTSVALLLGAEIDAEARRLAADGPDRAVHLSARAGDEATAA